MNLIIVHRDELDPSGIVRLTGTRARHLAAILRVTAGDLVRVGVLGGPHGSGEVQMVSDGSTADLSVTLACTFDERAAEEPRVDVLLALPRPKVMRRLWAQFSALGVGRIMLTNAARVERHYFDTHILSPECYLPLLIEGLQQAKDTYLPRVSIHKQFRALVEDDLDHLSSADLRLLADPSGAGDPISLIVDHASRRVLLAIGPEGGWNDFERSLLTARSFAAASIGPRVLRSDTACIAWLGIVHQALRTRSQPPTR